MSATAASKKSASLKVGQVWEIGVQVNADTEAASPVEAPVRVLVTGPDGVTRTFVADHLGKGKHRALVALSSPGDYSAAAEVDGPNSATLDGFTATAK